MRTIVLPNGARFTQCPPMPAEGSTYDAGEIGGAVTLSNGIVEAWTYSNGTVHEFTCPNDVVAAVTGINDLRINVC